MKKKKRPISTIAAAIIALASVTSAPPAAAASIKELLEGAFDSPNGMILAPVDGQMADAIRRAAPIRGDVVANIKTIKHFKEKDCRRFSIELLAEFAPESGAKGNMPLPKIELNYCKGGGFPQEGVDPEAGRKFMEQVDQYAQRRTQRTAPAVMTAPPQETGIETGKPKP